MLSFARRQDGLMTDITVNTATPASALAQFRARRELAVVQPQGNLALVNTQWVDSPQPVYGVPGVWSPLSHGESGLMVTATAADHIQVDGVVVDGSVVVAGKDSAHPSSIVFSDTVTGFVIASEEGTYGLRVWDAESDGIHHFGSIDAFDHNPDWVIQATWTEIEGGSTVGIEHLKDGGKPRDKVVPGEITFLKDGVDYNLAAFKEGRALLLVFADATNGVSSYSVGRFLMVAPNADGSITLDFNRAFLPPCGFSYNFNCPLPPKQNRFSVAIEAGEKNVLNKAGELLH